MAEKPDPEKLEQLDARIRSARKAKEPAPPMENEYTQAGMAWRMVLELTVGMVMGFGIGYGLDSLFDTLPILLILFTLLGFAAGVRTMMHTARELNKSEKKPAARAGVEK